MILTKPELRNLLKIKRLALSSDERASKSGLIVNRLNLVLDWSGVNAIHIFEPIIELGEVNVSKFSSHGGLFTSRKTEGKWQVVALNEDTSAPEKFDVIIVPMLGFDSSLHRLGYGGGYYDKFLATQPQAKKIGVCFEAGRVGQLPSQDHDVQMDLIITEAGVFT